ncbi:MAG: diacylglycerol kinase family lipid kinase [Solibacillus sp.]
MQLHFIVNAFAGGGKGKEVWQRFEKQLTVPYELHFTSYSGHTSEIARKLAQATMDQESVCLIAVGGDGTIHELVNGAGMYEQIIIGVIAAGSGNDFARGYEIFESPEQIERFIETRDVTAHDYGVAHFNEHTKIFVNNFGIGFDALVGKLTNESQLKKWLNRIKLGKISYAFFVIYALFTFKPFQLRVLHNGHEKRFKDVWFVTVSNQKFFGGGMNLSPTSDTSDGILEVTVVSELSKWKLLFVFMTVYFARHTKFKEVHQFSSNAVTLKSDAAILGHADGETQVLPHGHNTIEFVVKEKAWKLAKKSKY